MNYICANKKTSYQVNYYYKTSYNQAKLRLFFCQYRNVRFIIVCLAYSVIYCSTPCKPYIFKHSHLSGFLNAFSTISFRVDSRRLLSLKIIDMLFLLFVNAECALINSSILDTIFWVKKECDFKNKYRSDCFVFTLAIQSSNISIETPFCHFLASLCIFFETNRN